MLNPYINVIFLCLYIVVWQMTKPQIKTWPIIYYENYFLIGAFWQRPKNFSSFQKEGVWRKKLIFWLHGRCNSSTKRITFPGLGCVAWIIAKDMVKSLEQYNPSPALTARDTLYLSMNWHPPLLYGRFAHFQIYCNAAFSNLSAIACFSNFRQCLDVMPAAHYSPCLV